MSAKKTGNLKKKTTFMLILLFTPLSPAPPLGIYLFVVFIKCCAAFLFPPHWKKKRSKVSKALQANRIQHFQAFVSSIWTHLPQPLWQNRFCWSRFWVFFFFVEIHFFVFCVLFFSYPLPAPVNGKKKPTTQKKPPLSLIKRLPDSFYFFFFIVFFTEAHLNSCFKHFIYFVLEFSLVDPKVFFLFLFLIK